MWVVQIAAEGTYDITTDGDVNGYINPQLAFGHDSSNGTLVWAFAGLFVIGLLELTASIIYAVRTGKRPVPAAPVGPTFHVGDSYGVRRSVHADRRRDPDRAAQKPGGTA